MVASARPKEMSCRMAEWYSAYKSTICKSGAKVRSTCFRNVFSTFSGAMISTKWLSVCASSHVRTARWMSVTALMRAFICRKPTSMSTDGALPITSDSCWRNRRTNA